MGLNKGFQTNEHAIWIRIRDRDGDLLVPDSLHQQEPYLQKPAINLSTQPKRALFGLLSRACSRWPPIACSSLEQRMLKFCLILRNSSQDQFRSYIPLLILAVRHAPRLLTQFLSKFLQRYAAASLNSAAVRMRSNGRLMKLVRNPWHDSTSSCCRSVFSRKRSDTVLGTLM